MSGVMFLSYTLLSSESNKNDSSRLEQLIQWCTEDFDGCLIFDECHKAKNATNQIGATKATKAALAVISLQDRLPKARVVYASATGNCTINCISLQVKFSY